MNNTPYGKLLFLCLPVCSFIISCGLPLDPNMRYKEKQLTVSVQGHTLNNLQVFSKDGNWIVYDTRNDDTKIGSTGTIEMVSTLTGEVKILYKTVNQSEYGPGVGAAAFSPTKDEVIFIQGILNSNKNKPYSLTRRTGVSIDILNPNSPTYMDARDVQSPFIKGALRGGTHAHSWSGDGKLISFTYNDFVIEQKAKTDKTLQDLRMVGIMMPGEVMVPTDPSFENNSGKMFSVVITNVKENPAMGSDEISKAFDECWIGKNGYLRSDGQHISHAIAFQGIVRDGLGKPVTEIFVADLPENLALLKEGNQLEGTHTTRPNVPSSMKNRRITFMKKGIKGPRHWLRSSPDGKDLFFLAEDEKGLIQIHTVSPNGGAIRKVSTHDFSVQGQFNISPDGNFLAYSADNSIYITGVKTGESKVVTKRFKDDEKPVGAPNWSPDGKTIAYNRYVKTGNDLFLQIFLISLN